MQKNILYLYVALQPYVVSVLKEFTKKGYKVYVVKWDKRLLTPYEPPEIENVEYFNRSEFKSVNDLYSFIVSINPSLIFICGWIDKQYCYATQKVKKNFDIPIIAGLDSQWRGGLQWAHVLCSKFRQQKWYTHFLVAGMWQYEYVRRLGFDKHHILTPLYSADVELFENVEMEHKQEKYPHKLLFIGRLSKEKGLLQLLEAWKNIKDKKDWSLTVIGNGKLKDEVQKHNDIKLIDFVSQEILCKEMSKSGCFILPSTFEPWALVIHEAAAAGLPILATKACGATTQFLINNYNGFVFEPNSVTAIEQNICNIINTSDEQLYKMGQRSRQLALKITPEYVVVAMLSTIK